MTFIYLENNNHVMIYIPQREKLESISIPVSNYYVTFTI